VFNYATNHFSGREFKTRQRFIKAVTIHKFSNKANGNRNETEKEIFRKKMPSFEL
jgi:hypothetical protein